MAETRPESGEGGAATAAPPALAARRPLSERFQVAGGVKTAAAVVVFVVAALAPLVITSAFSLQVMTIAALNTALAAGLVVSLGYTGLLNLSHGTFYGIGAYTTALLVTDHGVSFELAALAAMVAAALGGLVLGLVSLRVRGDYFALVSLAFTIALFEVMQNWDAATRGPEGFFGIPTQSLFGIPIDSGKSGFYAALLVVAVTVLIVWRIGRTFACRAMLAVRYDEAAARAMGIDVGFTKLLAMALSSALAGLAGAVLVMTMLFIRPEDFDLVASFDITLWVIIGGMASLWGVTIAAAAIAILTEGIRGLSDYRVGLIGLFVLFAVFLRAGVISDLIRSKLHHRAVNTVRTDL